MSTRLKSGCISTLRRSMAVPSRSSTEYATLPESSETQPLADVLRLGTTALRGRLEGRERLQCQHARLLPRQHFQQIAHFLPHVSGILHLAGNLLLHQFPEPLAQPVERHPQRPFAQAKPDRQVGLRDLLLVSRQPRLQRGEVLPSRRPLLLAPKSFQRPREQSNSPLPVEFQFRTRTARVCNLHGRRTVRAGVERNRPPSATPFQTALLVIYIRE